MTLYVWATVVSVRLEVPPSPKSQNRLVIVPVELSVNVTDKGTAPLVGFAPNDAAGKAAPLPVTALVELPPLEANTTFVVKVPTLSGVKLMIAFVVLRPGML